MLSLTLILAGCSTSAGDGGSDGIAPSSEEAAASASATPLIGTWTRTQDCDGMLAAFEGAGLAESQLGWVTGNWFAEGTEPGPGGPCDGSRPAEEHSHFFTEAGAFGSTDAQGAQVDDGDYVLVDDDTLSFPSHAREFQYSGEVLVDFGVDGDSATFEVQIPDDCTNTCADAYAWALSAFYQSDTWERE